MIDRAPRRPTIYIYIYDRERPAVFKRIQAYANAALDYSLHARSALCLCEGSRHRAIGYTMDLHLDAGEDARGELERKVKTRCTGARLASASALKL